MEFLNNPRLSYSPIEERPDFSWPDGKRLAVYVALCVEHFSYGSGLGLPYSPGLQHPNNYNWAWREYGNRVGGFRLARLFDEYDLPLSILLNTACYDHCPELVSVFRERGDEIVAHGHTNSENRNGMSVEDETALIDQVTRAIRENEGTAPRGWMSPGAHPGPNTEDLLKKAGYDYTLDWPMDDQPAWLKTSAGPLMSIPYPHEVNDVPMVVLHDGTASAFADMAIDNLEEMMEQSKHQPLVYGITIHSFIVGQPFRIRQFRRVLDALKAHSDDIWFTTPGQICDHYQALPDSQKVKP